MELFGTWWLVGAAMLFNNVFGVNKRQGIPMTRIVACLHIL